MRINQKAKADAGKLKLTLVPTSLIRAVAVVREYGCRKYKDPENWRKVEPQRYRDALCLWHLACNAAFLIELEMDRSTKHE